MDLSVIINPIESSTTGTNLVTSRQLRLALRSAIAQFPITPTLSELNVDGISILDRVSDAASQEMAANPNPGTVSGTGAVASALTGALDVGALYLVSYEILDNTGLTNLFIPASNGAPFPSRDLPLGIGTHHILIAAEDADTAALMRLTGEVTFGFVSCRKAEWGVDLPPATTGPELAATTDPGTLSGSGVTVTALSEPLVTGDDYVISYEITACSGADSVFTPANNGSPFAKVDLPASVGHHDIVLTAVDKDTSAALRMTGEITFGALSIRRRGNDAGQQLYWRVDFVNLKSEQTVYTPAPTELHVDPSGSDTLGTGALETPFRQPAAAAAIAKPGDTIYLHPGIYEPFEALSSGTEGAPITFTTPDGEERRAIINGMNAGDRIRGGIQINGKDYVHIRNLLVEDAAFDGIHISGIEGEQHGHHVIAGCQTRRTGNSGIFVCGNVSSTVLPANDIRTIDILVEENDVSETNIVNDYTAHLRNSLDEPGGVNEAISVARGVDGVIVRNNLVHDSRQYGIDFKHGVFNGEITGNQIWNIQRHGIYLDTNRRILEDISISGNVVWGCGAGIVLGREADFDEVADADGTDMRQAFRRIDVFNNVVHSIEKTGIFCCRHSGDSPHGEITDVRIRFNTIYNCSTSGTGNEVRLVGWSDADFVSASVVSGFEFIGNLMWRDATGGLAFLVDEFSGVSGFTIRDNFYAADPLFTGPALDPPVLTLQVGSPARGVIDSGDAEAPFDETAAGVPRISHLSSGAY